MPDWCEQCRRLTSGDCGQHVERKVGVADVMAVHGPACWQAGHDFVHLRSEIKERVGGVTRSYLGADRIDTYYCRRCLEYRTKTEDIGRG